MNKLKDFSSELELLSHTVDAEVGTIMEAIREQKSKRLSQPPTADEQPKNIAMEEGSAPSAPTDATPAPARTVGRSRTKQRSPALDEQVVVQNVTTRLRRETNERLTEAALRQRLKKESPATRQDIVEQAIQQWLRRHGYSRDEPASERDTD